MPDSVALQDTRSFSWGIPRMLVGSRSPAICRYEQSFRGQSQYQYSSVRLTAVFSRAVSEDLYRMNCAYLAPAPVHLWSCAFSLVGENRW
jgi:hypothetical protein